MQHTTREAAQAEADESARIYANATGSRGASYIIQWQGEEITGRYSRCTEWDNGKQTICGTETTHTPCKDHSQNQ